MTEDCVTLYREGATRAQEDEAKAILEALNTAYPGHPWGVRVYGDDTGGGFFIRHLDFPANWGMNCRHTTRLYSASALKRAVIMMAGEWLERAALLRGPREPDAPQIRHLEGVPEDFQPDRKKPLAAENVVFDAGQETQPLRETPRPQVAKEMENA